MPILPIDAGRYGSDEIKKIFDEHKRLDYQLEFEACVAESQSEIGVIPASAAKEIAQKARSGKISVQRVKELEAVSEHDTAAMVEALCELCSDNAKPWTHYGLTSYDVVDTVISMQIRDSLSIIEPKIARLCPKLAYEVKQYDDIPAVRKKDLCSTSTISFGLVFHSLASEMGEHINRVKEMRRRVLVCKTLGVVGTGSLMRDKALEVQKLVARKLGLYPVHAATQVVSRERHAEFIFCLALIASTLEKIAIQLHNLQRFGIKEFNEAQIGFGVLPLRKTTNLENIFSLASIVRGMLNVSLDNVALWHEMDLSTSANERFTLPMTVIILDEILNIIIDDLSTLHSLLAKESRRKILGRHIG